MKPALPIFGADRDEIALTAWKLLRGDDPITTFRRWGPDPSPLCDGPAIAFFDDQATDALAEEGLCLWCGHQFRGLSVDELALLELGSI